MVKTKRSSVMAKITFAVFMLLLTFVLSNQRVQSEEVKLTILLVNDIYNIEYDTQKDRGGFSRLASIVKSERAKSKNVIFAHAGDTYSPSLLSSFDKGKHIVELTNMLNPTVFVPGNHEFDFGPVVFKKRIADSKFPILAANLRNKNGSKLKNVQDTLILTYGKLKVGIIGLAADNSPVKSSTGDLVFKNAVKVGVENAQKLKKAGADIIIAVTHSPRSQDQELFTTGAFDIILSGDDHDLFLFHDGKRLMIESGEEAETVIAIDLSVNIKENDKGRKVSWYPTYRFIDSKEAKQDEKVLAKVKKYVAKLSKELDIPIGKISTPLDSRRSLVRGEESAIGNLIADAIRKSTKSDVAIMNGGGIRGNKEYPAGTILSRRDILSELPFGNITVKLELSGAMLLQALENGYSQIKDGAGRFAQISGMRINVDFSRKPGKRVISATVNGKTLSKNKLYTLATNDYVARGGDGYTVFKKAKVLLRSLDGKLLASEVIDFIKSSKSVSPKIDGRISQKK